MQSQLRNLLDKIYELEGLVHLALKRDDFSEDFIRLISKKGEEVSELSNLAKGSNSEKLQELNSQPSNEPSFSLEEYSIDEDENSNQKDSINIGNKPSVSINPSSSPDNHRGKLVFSINDKYRFRKELFHNSDADFNNTLALVASMEHYDEAEDYFINEEEFDRDDPVVREFLNIIKRYFK